MDKNPAQPKTKQENAHIPTKLIWTQKVHKAFSIYTSYKSTLITKQCF